MSRYYTSCITRVPEYLPQVKTITISASPFRGDFQDFSYPLFHRWEWGYYCGKTCLLFYSGFHSMPIWIPSRSALRQSCVIHSLSFLLPSTLLRECCMKIFISIFLLFVFHVRCLYKFLKKGGGGLLSLGIESSEVWSGSQLLWEFVPQFGQPKRKLYLLHRQALFLMQTVPVCPKNRVLKWILIPELKTFFAVHYV